MLTNFLFGFTSVIALLWFLFFLFKKPSLINYIVIILFIVMIPAYADKLIGAVELSYNRFYTQFSFIDIAIIFFIVSSLYLKKSYITNNLIYIKIHLILFVSFTLIGVNLLLHYGLSNSNLEILIYYSFNYLRIVIFAVFSYIYLTEAVKMDFFFKKNDYFIFSLLLLIIVELVLFTLFKNYGRYQLSHLNVNVLPNALVIIYLTLVVINRANIFYFLAFLLIIVLTESRTGLILLFFIKFFIEHKFNIKYFLYLGVIFTILFFTNERIYELLTSLNEFQRIDTIRSRLQIWGGTYDIIQENLLIGIGPGMVYVNEHWLTYLNETFQYRNFMLSTHNEFLQQVIHIGLPLSILFFGIIYYIIIKSKSFFHIIPISIIFMINSNFETIRFDMIFGLYLGTILVFEKSKAKTSYIKPRY